MTRVDVPLYFSKGTCHVLYAFDVGMEIDVVKGARLITSGTLDGSLRPNRRFPRYFDYHPAPLRITQEIAPIAVWEDISTTPSVEMVLYDFGGVSVTYALPFEGGAERIRNFSDYLTETDILLKDARTRVERLVASIASVIERPRVADLVEDYVIFQVEELQSNTVVDELPSRYGPALAQILRGEKQPLSDEEIRDALSCAISYSPEDLTLIDWYAALVFDREADDVRAVLEFANVELLELRLLDHQLDNSLEETYDILTQQDWLTVLGLRHTAQLRRVGQLVVEAAILFERVSNAIKLLGDQYLARVYRLAAHRFHLAEWNTALLRKLDAIESLYQKISDRTASRRLELLEWIIILLIAFEVVWSLWKR